MSFDAFALEHMLESVSKERNEKEKEKSNMMFSINERGKQKAKKY